LAPELLGVDTGFSQQPRRLARLPAQTHLPPGDRVFSEVSNGLTYEQAQSRLPRRDSKSQGDPPRYLMVTVAQFIVTHRYLVSFETTSLGGYLEHSVIRAETARANAFTIIFVPLSQRLFLPLLRASIGSTGVGVFTPHPSLLRG
jgi:hypothetical protein